MRSEASAARGRAAGLSSWRQNGEVAMFKPHSGTLRRVALCLEPLVEADLPELLALAVANGQQLIHMNGPLRPDWYRQALAAHRDGLLVIFAVRLDGRLAGTTRFLDFIPNLSTAEIGATWLAAAHHGGGLNTAMKFLMLRQAFEQWEMV